ncbi:MAG: metalloregulator ArsR/SmtB family transcription factor [Micrococcales bacterium]|nr:metalloregulator ArsR/SmtB family transcription factor [Micrococcales bacterium]
MNESRDAVLAELAVVGKVFASARRLEIIEVLAQSEHSVDEIVRATGQGLSSVSAHLQILRAANLVRVRRQGTRQIYRLADADVAALYAALGAAARRHSPDVSAALEAYLGSGGGDVDQLSREQVLDLIGRQDVAVLDVRPADEYAAGHITGAVSMPLAELGTRLADVDPGARIVTYCRGAYCVMAHDAVTLIRAHGRDAVRLQDGMLEWRMASLPVSVGV